MTNQYDLETYNVSAGGSLIVPFGDTGPVPAMLDLYFRAVNGSVKICTTNLPANSCTAGFELLQGETFAGPVTGLGIDLTKTNLQITNPGLTEATVLVGAKI